MVNWIVAESLSQLHQQLNQLAPGRNRASDGSIGDAVHATRDSDHNPWVVLNGQPLVTARDWTHDPAGGLDCARLRDALIRGRDARVKYIIFNQQIISGAGGPQPWVRRRYYGANPHTRHLHLSVVADRRCRIGTPWLLPGLSSPVTPTKYPTLQRGSTGEAVKLIQRFLGVVGPGDVGYGYYGPLTEGAVKRYQEMRGIPSDGVVGPQTWAETGF